MVVQLATPPQTLHALADTGSDLVWARCKPFNGTGGPVPNLKSSLSYKPIRCLSSQCRALGCDAHCSKTRCRFQYGYSDGSKLARDFSLDTLTMTGTDGKPPKFNNFCFGCAHQASVKIGRIGGFFML
ncbi:hypothetical protein O6H91_12G014500 [Diphasiastrum complanatum]|uniref:Uncharacterized protein n=1 Tax=Diphasiastrum complanatum TaxID=34168 RepID=A0ACC2BZ44_DIPCM|nr:hypothetical protein O6H91_12G014500 [Diphasiastrum complanatum]